MASQNDSSLPKCRSGRRSQTMHHKVTPGTFEVDLVNENNDIDMVTPRRTISAHGHSHAHRGSSTIPIMMPLRNPLNVPPPDRRHCLDFEDEYDISYPDCEEKNNNIEDYNNIDVDAFLESAPASISRESSPEKSSKPHLDDFELLSVIGRGAYGKVFLTQRIVTGDIYAMKCIKKADIIQNNVIKHAKSERSVLVALSHPFIVRLRFAFQTSTKIYLILDYISGGELFTRLNTVQFFMQETAVFYAAELVLAIEHLHSRDILYRDLKPENVLLNADGHICLTDMGLAVHSPDSSGARSFCGTAEYMSPEVIRRAQYGKPADWWSFGALLFEMLTGDVPFRGKNPADLQKKILREKLRFPSHLNLVSKNILKSLLNRNIEKRLGTGPNGVDAIKDHRFFKGINWELLEQKQITPPYVPDLTHDKDTKFFDPQFTTEPAVDSATDSDQEPLSNSLQAHFTGFSFQH